MPANDIQIGGDHYKGASCPNCGTSIEHWDLAWLFRWDNFQYAITKYVMRWRSKHGVEDLRKAQHCLEKYIEVVLRDEAKLNADEDRGGGNFKRIKYEKDEGPEVENTNRGGGYVRVTLNCPRCNIKTKKGEECTPRSDGERVWLYTCPRCHGWSERSEGEETSDWFEAMPTPDRYATTTYTRPSPELDESGEPGPGYTNQDPDIPLRSPRWPKREPGEAPGKGDPGR